MPKTDKTIDELEEEVKERKPSKQLRNKLDELRRLVQGEAKDALERSFAIKPDIVYACQKIDDCFKTVFNV
jgi:hypothetical protein